MLASVVIVAFVWLLIFSLMTSAKRADEDADRLLAELDQEAVRRIRGPLGCPLPNGDSLRMPLYRGRMATVRAAPQRRAPGLLSSHT